MKEIDIIKILKYLFSKLVIILISGALCAAIGFGYSVLIEKPVYRTSCTILVNNGALTDEYTGSSIVSGSNISASLGLVTTCVDILKSDNIYKDLAASFNNEYSYDSLQRLFYIRARSEDSLLIDIYAYGSNPNQAKILANNFLEIVPTYIPNTITNAGVKILATADKVVKTGPRTSFNIGVGALVGVVLSSAFFLILFCFKNTIQSEKDFKNNYTIPLLGTVPYFENNKTGGKRNGKFGK